MNRKSDFKGVKFPKKMFEIDPETGKITLFPLQFEDEKVKRGNSATKRSPIKIEALDFNKIRKEIEGSENQSKKRKIDAPHSAKRLFASSVSQTGASANNRRSKQLVMPKKSKILHNPTSSPLLNMEEVEEEILTNGKTLSNHPFKPVLKEISENVLHSSHGVKKPEFEIPKILVDNCEKLPLPTSPSLGYDSDAIEDEPKTPDSTREFHKLELMCTDSPMTNMCNLMQDTVINSLKKPKVNANSNPALSICIQNIEKLIKEEEVRHKQNISQLNNVLTTLKSLISDDKEIPNRKENRRSERLLKKSPLKSSKLLTSPAILRSDDLRKSTLKKNMVAKNPNCTESPRGQKALALYNSIRSQNLVLETPRSDRKGSNLSHRIHAQCLLLQDTPVHH